MTIDRVNYFLRLLGSRIHGILSLRVLAAPPWGVTFRQHVGGDVAIYTEYLYDAPAMTNYFSACDDQRHNYALLDYFCACNQNDFHFTMGGGIDYNLPSATLDDLVVNNFGRKDTLGVTPVISTFILLWTATIIIVVAFVLNLSTTTSTTIEVGMKDVWTGLVEVFGMSRINLLEDERHIFKRKSGGAIVTYLRNEEYNVVYGSCKDAFRPVMPIHERLQFYLSSKREQASSKGLPKVLTAHSNMGGILTQVIRITQMTWLYGFVLQCLVSSSMGFCLVVSVESKYGQWRRSYARAWDASLLHSRISLVSFMTTRSVRALEGHVAWSSRISLVTLMSGA